MSNDLITQNIAVAPDDYNQLINNISSLWKCGTLSHKLTWSHYYEILKCNDPLEMQFYMNQCIHEGWKVRELKRQTLDR